MTAAPERAKALDAPPAGARHGATPGGQRSAPRSPASPASPRSPGALGRLSALGRRLHAPDPTTVLGWLWRVGIQTVRRWRGDGCSRQAASLAYKSMLGLVPLAAFSFTLLRSMGTLGARSALIEFFAGNLFPAQEEREAVSTALLQFADRLAEDAIGPIGLGVLIIIVFLLFLEIESFWNGIWSSPRPRSLVSKFFVFYALATLVPFLMAVSLYHTAHYWRSGLAAYVAPLSSIFVALLLANRLLPAVRVRWHHAALGAAVSAVLYELAKFSFSHYAALVLGRYQSVYGALGLLPLLLVWIYVSWLVVLLGAEVAHAAQRLASLEAAERRQRRSDDQWRLVSGPTAARLLLEMTRSFTQGLAPPTTTELVERFGLPEEVVMRVLESLREKRLVLETGGEGPDGAAPGWVPGRPPSTILLGDVLGLFRPADPQGSADALGRILRELAAHETQETDLSLAELLAASTGEARGEDGCEHHRNREPRG